MTTLVKPSKSSYDGCLFNAYVSEAPCHFAFGLSAAALAVAASAILFTGPAGIALIFGFGLSLGFHSLVLGGGCMGYW